MQVFLRPDIDRNGSLWLRSPGTDGTDGAYVVVGDRGRDFAACPPLREQFHVWADDEGVLRTDHQLSLWSAPVVRFHYRLNRTPGRGIAASARYARVRFRLLSLYLCAVAGSGDPFGYGWLDPYADGPGGRLHEATCLGFFEGVPVDDVVAQSGIVDPELADPGDPFDDFSRLPMNPVAVLPSQGWTVVYQDNGLPGQFMNTVAQSPNVARAVIVFWNVNAYTEFAYWERGELIVSFDFPQDRIGADPDRLASQMAQTVGLVRTGEEPGLTNAHIYQQMLALAETITGIHLDPDFLTGPRVVIGCLDDDADDSFPTPPNDDFDPYGGSIGDWRVADSSSDAAPEWSDDQRRANEQVLEAIPPERRSEIPARLARLACEHVRIADEYPVNEILDDIDRGKRPHPAQMTVRSDIYAVVEHVVYGAGAPSKARVQAAIEAVFEAAKPKSRRAPLDVLLYARVAADDQGTRMIEQLRANLA